SSGAGNGNAACANPRSWSNERTIRRVSLSCDFFDLSHAAYDASVQRCSGGCECHAVALAKSGAAAAYLRENSSADGSSISQYASRRWRCQPSPTSLSILLGG